MKPLFFTIAAIVVMGCGGVGSVSGQAAGEDDNNRESPPPPPAQTKPDNAVVEQSSGDARSPDFTGMWENSSCGERKYKRSVNFEKEGRFNALDEVAPCPPDKRCVWSGIIRWSGTWTLEDRTITLDIKPPDTGKLPENVPQEFAVVDDDPISIGERSGEVICPYKKGK